jgi:hypothetical protein
MTWGNPLQGTLPSKGARRKTDSLEGKMTETQSSQDVSTKLERKQKLAKEKLRQPADAGAPHRRELVTRPTAAARGRAAGRRAEKWQRAEYWEANPASLLDRAKSGRQQRRRCDGCTSKGDGTKSRPIGIRPSKMVLQRAVAMVIHESTSRSLRLVWLPAPSPSAQLCKRSGRVVANEGGWLVEVDVRVFDTVDHAHPRAILRRRIGDGCCCGWSESG